MQTLTAITFACLITAGPSADPKAALEPFDGKWQGTFRVYSQTGELLTTLNVQQHYRWDGDVQRGTFIETDDAGNTITAEARNYINKDGELICEVVKSNGETSNHRGTVTDGLLFWHANEPGRVETFKERVETDDQGTFYVIDGFGIYGTGDDAQSFLFEGKYRRVDG